jgi:uncharacterized protein DUF3667
VCAQERLVSRLPPADAADAPGEALTAVPSLRAMDAQEDRHCRNCGIEATGHYCGNCGQETALALPSAGLFLREAAGRYIPLDGRLWRSLQALLFRPGHLTREYFAGRRRRYVRPARLFVALSIAFFAILRVTTSLEYRDDTGPVIVDTRQAPVANAADREDLAQEANTGAEPLGLHVDRDFNLSFDARTLPLLAPLRSRVEAFNRLPREEKADRLLAGVLRYAPYAAIGLLPAFALLLKIAYAGRQRRYPSRPRRYAAHLVFGAHNHAFLFLALALAALIDFKPLRVTLIVWMVAYALLSMKVVYGGGWTGVVLRAIAVAAVYLVFFAVAVAGLLIAAVMLR